VLKETVTYRDRIVVDPDIMAGKPVVRGTRIPVDLVLKRLSEDFDLDHLFAAYPRLTREDVQACLAYANQVVAVNLCTRQRCLCRAEVCGFFLSCD